MDSLKGLLKNLTLLIGIGLILLNPISKPNVSSV